MWETEIRSVDDFDFVLPGTVIQLQTPMKVSFIVDSCSGTDRVIQGRSISRPGPHYIILEIPQAATHGKSGQVLVKDGDEQVVSSISRDNFVAEPILARVLFQRDLPRVGEIPVMIPSDLRHLSERKQLVFKSGNQSLTLKLDGLSGGTSHHLEGSGQVVNSNLIPALDRGTLIDFSLSLDPSGHILKINEETYTFPEVSYIEQSRRRSSSDGESPRFRK